MKKSFTIIELLISVVIMSVLFLLLSNLVKNLNITKNILNQSYKQVLKENTAVKVLYYDILDSEYVSLSQRKNYTVIYMRTANSLHDIPEPYVVWYVSKNDNALMRMEMPKKVVFLSNAKNYYLDKFAQNVKIFKIYKYFYKYFIYIDNGKPVYFEMYKGFL